MNCSFTGFNKAAQLVSSVCAISFIFASCCENLLNKTFRLVTCRLNSVFMNVVRIAAVNDNKESQIPDGLLIEELRLVNERKFNHLAFIFTGRLPNVYNLL